MIHCLHCCDKTVPTAHMIGKPRFLSVQKVVSACVCSLTPLICCVTLAAADLLSWRFNRIFPCASDDMSKKQAFKFASKTVCLFSG